MCLVENNDMPVLHDIIWLYPNYYYGLQKIDMGSNLPEESEFNSGYYILERGYWKIWYRVSDGSKRVVDRYTTYEAAKRRIDKELSLLGAPAMVVHPARMFL